MKGSIPPIVRAADVLLADVERAINAMARRHKHTYGGRLSSAAMELARLANRAWRDRSGRLKWLEDLVWAVDDFKTLLRLGHSLSAFSSLGQFEQLARLAYELGSQVGGWLKDKQQHPKGQNEPPPARGGQRAPILSSRAAQPSGASR